MTILYYALTVYLSATLIKGIFDKSILQQDITHIMLAIAFIIMMTLSSFDFSMMDSREMVYVFRLLSFASLFLLGLWRKKPVSE